MRYLILSLSILLFASSCTKSSSPTPSTEAILAKSSWKVTSGTVVEQIPHTSPRRDTTWKIPVSKCQSQMIFTFNDNYTGTLDGSSSACNAGKQPFTWYLLNDNTLGIINANNFFDSSIAIGTMSNISATQFSYSYNFVLKLPNPFGKLPYYDTISYHMVFTSN